MINNLEREGLLERLSDKLEVDNNLNRKIVSFQANKVEPFNRWFKYKEGFSSTLVEYFIKKYSINSGRILDPFAGAGTTLFEGKKLGFQSFGIELLPVGIFATEVRKAVEDVNLDDLHSIVKDLWSSVRAMECNEVFIKHIPITKDAFPDDTEVMLNKYLCFCESIIKPEIKIVLKFAAFSVLEEISYTRKDGQYLRWDYRSKRNLKGKKFDKGNIVPFEIAVDKKLKQIIGDLSSHKIDMELFATTVHESKDEISIEKGSCLEILPKLSPDFFDVVITSPPYCNRYDYTRTYALELVFLGYTNEDVRALRQEMLSCTVENKEKLEFLREIYKKAGDEEIFDRVVNAYFDTPAMIEVNDLLEELAKTEKLNNNNISRMVRNYFLEMCFVIFELSRVLKPNGYCIMVNDNVRYGGEEIPVDLILSDFAKKFDFEIVQILVLPKGKGNSSQQMGSYGRTEIRKCVYVWQKK